MEKGGQRCSRSAAVKRRGNGSRGGRRGLGAGVRGRSPPFSRSPPLRQGSEAGLWRLEDAGRGVVLPEISSLEGGGRGDGQGILPLHPCSGRALSSGLKSRRLTPWSLMGN